MGKKTQTSRLRRLAKWRNPIGQNAAGCARRQKGRGPEIRSGGTRTEREAMDEGCRGTAKNRQGNQGKNGGDQEEVRSTLKSSSLKEEKQKKQKKQRKTKKNKEKKQRKTTKNKKIFFIKY